MKNIYRIFSTISVFAYSVSALAQAPSDAPEVICKPADKLIETVQQVYNLPKDLVNVLNVTPKITLTTKNGGQAPSAVFLKSTKTAKQVPLKMDEKGKVLNLEELVAVEMPAESCRPNNLTDDKLQLSFTIAMQFKNSSGTYSYAELAEGTDDGTQVVKSMAPAMMRFMVPAYESIIIGQNPDKPNTKFMFKKNGADVDVPVHELIGQGHYVLIKDMKKAGVDTFELEPPLGVAPFFGEDTIKKYQAKMAKEKSTSGG